MENRCGELLDGDFDHLDTINLYHFEDGKFQLVA